MKRPLESLIRKLRKSPDEQGHYTRLPEYVWDELGPGHNALRPAIADRIEQRLGEMQHQRAKQAKLRPQMVTDGELAELLTDKANAQIREGLSQERHLALRRMVRQAIRDVKDAAVEEAKQVKVEINSETQPLEELDIRALSLARRARNEALQKAAAAEEAKARVDWVERTGGRDMLGVGFRGHGREEAALSEPMKPKPDKDAAALAEFRRLAESGEAPWLEPRRPFDPLAGHVSQRTVRKDARAARAAAGDDAAQGEPRDRSNQRACRDKGDCRPPASRSR